MQPDEVRKHADKPRSKLRRSDRAMPASDIQALLVSGDFGVLATEHEGQPYATPVNYVYLEEDHALYFHGAHTGRTRTNLALNPRVCFNLSKMGALTAGEKSSDFGVDYRSVTVFGTVSKLSDEEKITAVLLALMQKYFPEHQPGEDYPLPAGEELKRTAVYRITIEEWSGKQRG